MKALILNSGMGKRMGSLTSEHPKCMTEIGEGETILSRQLRLLQRCGVTEVVMTTGLFEGVLIDYCKSLNLPIQYSFVLNPIYDKTNYIYSIFLAREHVADAVILMHGDLVFEMNVLEDAIGCNRSCMMVNSRMPLSPKDFKAVVKNGRIERVGVEFFTDAVAAQPLYKINKEDWGIWLQSIERFCENGQVSCYAENAFNDVSDKCRIYAVDFGESLCAEVDTPEDLGFVQSILSNQKESVLWSRGI